MAIIRPVFPKLEVSEQNLKKFNLTKTAYFEQWFSSDVLERFEVGGAYIDANGVQREIIPIRDINDALVAFSARSLDSSWPKYIFTDGFQRKHNLYNIRCLNDYNDIIIVEGFKAVWFLHTLGYKNATACMGPRLSPIQINLLITHPVRRLILMLDGGNNNVAQEICDRIKKKIDVKIISLPDEDKSPDDYPQEFIMNLLTEI